MTQTLPNRRSTSHSSLALVKGWRQRHMASYLNLGNYPWKENFLSVTLQNFESRNWSLLRVFPQSAVLSPTPFHSVPLPTVSFHCTLLLASLSPHSVPLPHSTPLITIAPEKAACRSRTASLPPLALSPFHFTALCRSLLSLPQKSATVLSLRSTIQKRKPITRDGNWWKPWMNPWPPSPSFKDSASSRRCGSTATNWGTCPWKRPWRPRTPIT